MKSLIYLILFSSSYFQTFNPETGELIEDRSDSTSVKFNSSTGQLINSNNKISTPQLFKGTTYQIQQMARDDVKKFFSDEMITYQYLGGATSLASIGPSGLIGLISGAIIQAIFTGDSEGEFAIIGYLAGLGFGAYGVPRLIAQLDSEKTILLELDHIQSLSKDQQKIYFDEFKKELKRIRLEKIYRGELQIITFSVGLPILMLMIGSAVF